MSFYFKPNSNYSLRKICLIDKVDYFISHSFDMSYRRKIREIEKISQY